MENINLKSINGKTKVVGTMATVGGAIIMTLVTGPVIMLPWAKEDGHYNSHPNHVHHYIKGAVMITGGCFMILQTITLRSHPPELSLTAWICSLGAAEGAVLALIMERGNAVAAWSIHWDIGLVAVVYTGIFCSGLAYYIQGIIMKERGPVFVTAFSPLNMVIVAILSTFIFREKLYVGRVAGAITIVIGLYAVVWGKRKDYAKQPSNGGVQVKVDENETDIEITNMLGT